jgi:SAM-dependent methyltransferase
VACVLCGSLGPFTPCCVKDGYHIEACGACGLVQLHPLPAREVLDSLYGEAYFATEGAAPGYDDYEAQEAEYRATFEEELCRIAAFRPSGTVLDVGCGYGYFVRAALDAGYNAYGVDVAAKAVETASARLPGRVFRGTVADVPDSAARRFDVVFVSHLIEHICEPVTFVSELEARMAAGGILVLVTPDIESLLAKVSRSRWVSFKLPEHVCFYSAKTVGDLITRCGLRLLTVEAAYQHYRLPFVAKRIRQLLHPVSAVIPPVERLPGLRSRIMRVTSGSLRAIAVKKSPETA